MQIQQSLEELQNNLKEINRQNKLRLLRKILKFLLIGFLIGRGSERRIAELSQRSKLILDNLLKPFEDIAGAEQQIREFADAYTRLTYIERKSADAKSIVPKLEERLGKHRETIIAQAKAAIEQREYTAERLVLEATSSGTYLIYTDRKRCIDIVKSLDEDLKYCGQSAILDGKYISEKQKKMEALLQTVSDYNGDFIKQRKMDHAYLWKKGLLSLDDEQQTAIVTDDKHNLVVAAAGSGKTEVLI